MVFPVGLRCFALLASEIGIAFDWLVADNLTGW
jgi:hypothetical protein